MRAVEPMTDSKTIRTLRTPGGGWRIELDLKRYDDLKKLPEGSTAALIIGADQSMRLVGPWEETVKFPISFLGRFNLNTYSRCTGVCGWISDIRGELPPAILEAHYQKLEDDIAAIIAAGGKPADVGCRERYLEHRRAGRYRKVDRDGRSLWNAMWRRAVPLLNAEALRITRSVNGGVVLYNLLVENPRLLELARSSAVILEFLTWIRSNSVLKATVEAITADRVELADATRIVLNAREDFLREGSVIGAGFIEWVKNARLTPSFLPYTDGPHRHGIIRHLLDAGASLDPNRMRAIRGRDSWYIFHVIASEFSELLPCFLSNPTASARSVLVETKHLDSPRKLDRIRSVLREVCDVIQASEQGLYKAGVGVHLSLARLIKESSRYHSAIRRERRAEMERRERLALLAPEEREAAVRNEREAALNDASAKVRERRALVFPEPVFVCVEDDEYRMQWIGDGWALECEGLTMGHCVASRAWACAGKTAVVYHIDSRREGEAPCTVEFNSYGRIVEIKSVNNRVAPSALTAWVLKQVRKRAPNGLFGDADWTDDSESEPDSTKVRCDPGNAKFPQPEFIGCDGGQYRLRWIPDLDAFYDHCISINPSLWNVAESAIAGRVRVYALERSADGFPIGTVQWSMSSILPVEVMGVCENKVYGEANTWAEGVLMEQRALEEEAGTSTWADQSEDHTLVAAGYDGDDDWDLPF